MWFNVAFPTCPRCDKNSNQCYHKYCPKGGAKPLEIDTESNPTIVRCLSCGKKWELKSTSYYCSCGYVFSAKDVEDELDVIVSNARYIARELQRRADTRNRITAITDKVIADVASDTIKKIGYGEQFGTFFKGLIPRIVKAVRLWLGI